MGRLLEHATPPPQATGTSRRPVTAAIWAAAVVGGCARCARSEPAAAALPAIPVDAPCPAEMARLPGGGCIDRYEASLLRGELRDPKGDGTTAVAASVAGQPPLTRASWHQARRACENAGKRLCGEAEWKAACRGSPARKYPYGPEFEPRRCNDWEASGHGAAGARPTGSFPRCVTDSGVYDLSGNVAEWIAEIKSSGPYVEVRGGTYNMIFPDTSCEADDYSPGVLDQRPDVGFRCCR